jgi:hypothetical protein
MPIFDVKPRSWEAYLAGIGASGVLMASALVIFVILIGVVTFTTWPHPGALLGDGGGDVALETSAVPTPAPARSTSLNLVKLLGGGAGPVAPHQGGVGRLGPGGIGGEPAPGDSGSTVGPTGPGSGGGEPQGAEQPPPPPSQSDNPVSQLLAGAGDTVQSNTDTLGDTLGGNSTPGVGGLVGGVGRALNSDLQSLAGNN